MMRGRAWWSLVVGATLVVVAFTSPAAASEFRLVVDETGRRVGVPARVDRIISLAPSITETLYALGVEARVVGVTDSCDFPLAARSKPSVGRVDTPSLEKIVALKPDLVLGTTAGNRRETVTALEQLGIALYGLNPHSIEDVLISVSTLADLLGVSQAGAELEAELRRRLVEVAARVKARSRPRVLFVLWLDPLMSIGRGTFIHDALARAGAESVSAGRAEDWPRLSLEEVLRQEPDYLILAHSPAVEQRLAAVRADPAWSRVRALREERIVVLDDAALRPSPRIVAVIEQLARALHREAFEPR